MKKLLQRVETHLQINVKFVTLRHASILGRPSLRAFFTGKLLVGLFYAAYAQQSNAFEAACQFIMRVVFPSSIGFSCVSLSVFLQMIHLSASYLCLKSFSKWNQIRQLNSNVYTNSIFNFDFNEMSWRKITWIRKIHSANDWEREKKETNHVCEKHHQDWHAKQTSALFSCSRQQSISVLWCVRKANGILGKYWRWNSNFMTVFWFCLCVCICCVWYRRKSKKKTHCRHMYKKKK